jgi:alkanesulfonate monooxygenase SsuD/methylene tetrahydromethanopterin reductase-like flavin-dependent oxidoreductase (luciferase family)
MRFGAHLPLALFSDRAASVHDLTDYATKAEELGFQVLAANDHLVFTRPYLDALASLAAVIGSTRSTTLMTTIALPVVRGPVQLAKTLTTIGVLSCGRLVAGVGPGSHRGDYAAVGIDFEERWPRFDDSVRALRHLLGRAGDPGSGRFYETSAINLEPKPSGDRQLPIWIASWGSEAGLRRVARLGDGWLASAYNTTPTDFADGWARLRHHLATYGREQAMFPNAIATMFFHVTERRDEAARMLTMVAGFLNRTEEHLRDALLIGSAEDSIAKLAAFEKSGAQAVLVWPVGDVLDQLQRFNERIMPSLS